MKGFVKKENNLVVLHCVQILFFNCVMYWVFPLFFCLFSALAFLPLLLVFLSLSLSFSFSFFFVFLLCFYLQIYAIKNSFLQQQKALSSLACALISLGFSVFRYVCLFVLLLSSVSSLPTN